MPAKLNLLLELSDAAVQWFDSTDIFSLLLVAFVFRLVVDRLPGPHVSVVPPVCSGIFLLAYFIHLYRLDGDQVECLFVSVMRSLVAGHIVWSVVAITILTIQWLLSRLNRLRWFLQRTAIRTSHGIAAMRASVHQWHLNRHPPPPLSEVVVPPPPPRSVLLRQLAEAAQADYDAEVAALTGLPLDEDERETILTIAKQRLISRLTQGDQTP